MLGRHAFDPESGAPLSDDKHYHPDFANTSGRDTGARTPVFTPEVAESWHSGREGALTNGELRSSYNGLIGYFRRCRRVACEGRPSLDTTAALAIKRLKSASDAHDFVIWYATAERLTRKSEWAAWMLDHTEPRCPHCGGWLKLDEGELRCASDENGHGFVETELRKRITSAYNQAFDAGLDPDDLRLF